jgi:hypothetical protein
VSTLYRYMCRSYIDTNNIISIYIGSTHAIGIIHHRWPTFSILVSLPTNKQTNYELKNIYTHSEMNIFIDSLIRCKLQIIYTRYLLYFVWCSISVIIYTRYLLYFVWCSISVIIYTRYLLYFVWSSISVINRTPYKIQ